MAVTACSITYCRFTPTLRIRLGGVCGDQAQRHILQTRLPLKPGNAGERAGIGFTVAAADRARSRAYLTRGSRRKTPIGFPKLKALADLSSFEDDVVA